MARFAVGVSLCLSLATLVSAQRSDPQALSYGSPTVITGWNCNQKYHFGNQQGPSIMTFFRRISVSILLSVATVAFGQQPASSPTALSYAAQSVAAMSGNTLVGDVTFMGNVNTWMAGSIADSGTTTLKIKGYGESRIDMQFTVSGALSQIRDASTGIAQGESITAGTGTVSSQQTCLTDASWFYPLNSAMAIAPNKGIVLSYIGPETLGGEPVQHLQSYSYQSGLDPASQAQVQLNSTIDYYLDATTLLPVAEDFNLYSNGTTAIPVQVLFLSYQTAGGITSPQRIQQYINGTLQLDVTITSVLVNTGIPLSTFTIPQ